MLQLLSFIVGVLLIAFAAFSYEDEEQRVSNWLEEAWTFLADGAGEFGDRAVLFLKTLITGTITLLNRFYGKRTISLRSYLSSVCLCIAFGIIICLYLGMEISYWTALPLAAALFLTPLIRNRAFYLLASLMFVAAIYSTYRFFDGEESINGVISGKDEVLTLSSALLVASIFDFLSVAVTRWALSRSMSASSLLGIVLYLLTVIINAVALLALPALFIFLRPFSGGEILTWIYILSGMSVLVALSFFIILAVSICLRLIAALLPRTLYMVIKFKLFENRKSTIGTGVFLIGIQFPQFSTMVERVSKALVG